MAEIIQLPAPQKDLSFPLMQALQERRSKRVWKDEALPLQEISNILWAACGITREGKYAAKSKRTAPSACNSQSIDVYAATKEGLFRYDEKGHRLLLILAEDIRGHIGTQSRMRSATAGLDLRIRSFAHGNSNSARIGQEMVLFRNARGLRQPERLSLLRGCQAEHGRAGVGRPG